MLDMMVSRHSYNFVIMSSLQYAERQKDDQGLSHWYMEKAGAGNRCRVALSVGLRRCQPYSDVTSRWTDPQ
jgi:hypothetical protein